MSREAKIMIGVLVLIVGGMIAIFVAGNGGSNKPQASSQPTVRATPDGLAGLLTTTQAWPANTDKLGERLDAIGLPRLSAEGTVLHIHQHLDIYINGKTAAVPPNIGIPASQGFISPLHVHDTTGVIHVESPTQQDFYLGQFFDVWGVKFDITDLGGYHADATNQLSVYVNGTKVTTDPRKIVLAAHQEIVVAYGPSDTLPSPIPSSYKFPSGE